MKPRRVPKWGVTIWEAEWRSQKWETYHLAFPILRSIRARLSMPEVLVAWTEVPLPKSCTGMDTQLCNTLSSSWPSSASQRCLSWGGLSDVTAPAHVISEEPGECIQMEGGDENKKWCKWVFWPAGWLAVGSWLASVTGVGLELISSHLSDRGKWDGVGAAGSLGGWEEGWISRNWDIRVLSASNLLLINLRILPWVVESGSAILLRMCPKSQS